MLQSICTLCEKILYQCILHQGLSVNNFYFSSSFSSKFRGREGGNKKDFWKWNKAVRTQKKVAAIQHFEIENKSFYFECQGKSFAL